jgi:hypothetical protein
VILQPSPRRIRPEDRAAPARTATAPDRRGIKGRDHFMSVLVTMKFQGDTAVFRQALADRAEEFVKVAELGRSSGAIHHRFGVGDGFVLVVDEWESADDFQRFFSAPELQAFIGSAGAAPVPPEITITEAIASPDEF